MTDLRLLANDLIGKKVKPKPGGKTTDNERFMLNYTFTIENVYPNYITAYTICENGYRLTTSFTVGELVERGLLISAGQIKDYEKNEKGVKEGYGHRGKGKPIKGRGQDTL